MQIDAKDIDWEAQSDTYLLMYARYQVPEALAEIARRLSVREVEGVSDG